MCNRMARFIFLVSCVLAFSSLSFAQTQDDLFNGDILHEIRIYIDPADWATFHATNFTCLDQDFRALEGEVISPLPRVECHFPIEFHWKFQGRDITGPQVSISSHGKGSRSNIKPSFTIDFARYESRNTFLGLRKIVLRANTQDASMMHERLAMTFFRRLGMPASREVHTRVFINDEYAGVYTITEAVDPVFVQSNFGESDGFLYSYEYAFPWVFNYLGPNSSKYSPLPFNPENNLLYREPAPLEAMVRAINDTPDAQFQAGVSQYVDLKAFLTEIAAENFVADQDSLLGDYLLNNFFLYRFMGKTVHTFIPWDKSNAFFGMDWPIFRNTQLNILSRRALAVPELMTFYRSVLARAVDTAGGPGGWLEQEIRKEYQQIQQAVYADNLKLCDHGASGNLRPCSNGEFEAEVAYLIAFARRRAIDVRNELTGGISQTDFAVTSQGGYTSTATASGSALKIGYARIQTNGGAATPSGLAIFSVRNGNMVVSETSVPASPLIQSGRIYAEVNGSVNTGLAIANPNAQAATVSFFFTDNTGRDFGQGSLTIPANGQIAQFLNGAPFNSGTLASGTFTFTSSVPVAAVALRGLTNERSDFLLTTLPVAPTTPQTGSLVFPHLADGGGWSTQVILLNPTDQTLSGSVQFVSQGVGSTVAGPLVVTTSEAGSDSAFNYSIPAHSAFRLRTTGGTSDVRSGSVRVVPTAGGSPSGVSILSFRNAGVTVSEAGVPAVGPAPVFRLYAEIGSSVQTGIAVSNSTPDTPAAVTLELINLDGSSTGFIGTLSVPPSGQTALFLNQVTGFAALPATFQGLLRISGSAGIAVVGLRGRYNERGDFLITTTPAVAENGPVPTTELVFPHIVEGGGYTTQFILFSGKPGQTASGTLRFLSQTGQPLMLSIR